MATTQREFHHVSEYFPLMPDDRLKELADDIEANGLLEPIWLYEDKILDGRNRYRACLLNGIEPVFQDYEGDRPVAFVLSKNLKRRDLSMVQRLKIADTMRPDLEKEAKARQAKKLKIGPVFPSASNDAHGGKVRDHIASAADVSPKTVERFHDVQTYGTAQLKNAVESEIVSISDAATIAKEPPAVQRAAVAAVESGKARTLKEAATRQHSQNGKPKFDDRVVDKALGQLVRALYARAKVHGEGGAFADIRKHLEIVSLSWKRWHKETTGKK